MDNMRTKIKAIVLAPSTIDISTIVLLRHIEYWFNLGVFM